MSNYVLFLDDEREPSLYLLVQHTDVVVCRTYYEAVQLVRQRGMPSHICFDHDLGPHSETGYDFAKWLVDNFMQSGRTDPIRFSVHSQNPVGALNIKTLLDNYNKHVAQQGEL